MRLVAFAACLALVVYLFRVDKQKSDDTSLALWIPLAWMFFAGSRFLSHWLGTGFGGDATDGSPIDRTLFFGLMAAALVVVIRRRVDWKGIFFRNKWVWLFFAFGILSAVWSPFPAVSLKRDFKAIGNILMVLVMLTEPRPYAAVGAVLRRLGYLTLPLSVVFIKWLPEMGRAYHSTGLAMYTGVGMQKNSLGQLCLLVGIYCAWSLLYKPSRPITLLNSRIRVEWLLIAMIAWLMTMANSATALMSLMAAVLAMSLGRFLFNGRPVQLVGFTVATVLTVVALESSLNITTFVIEALGRRPDLTTRLPMWEDILARQAGNPFLGVGYEAYWLTPQGLESFDIWKVGNTHNGYLETYLSSGLIGLAVLIAALLTTLWSVARHPKEDFMGAVLRLSFLIVAALYNWTESTFRGVSNIWIVFFIASMDVGLRRAVTEAVNAPVSMRLWRSRVPPGPRPPGARPAPHSAIRGASGARSAIARRSR